MTTSVLLSHVGELNGHDLRVIRDFAIEAPEPWRNALSRLTEAAEAARDMESKVESVQETLDDMEHTVAEAVKKLKQTVETLKRTFENAVITATAFSNFEIEIKEVLTELEPVAVGA